MNKAIAMAVTTVSRRFNENLGRIGFPSDEFRLFAVVSTAPQHT
jgi:hypothetical protein